jgi:S-adenosylhomocysteine hydrolase
VPGKIADAVARGALAAMGVKIDEMTDAQKRYLRE